MKIRIFPELITYGENHIKRVEGLQNEVNDFIKDKKVIDIKYQINNNETSYILVMYEG